MRPSHKNLEKLIKEAKRVEPALPQKIIVLGSYALIERIYREKKDDVELNRDSKDIDLMIFPEDENNFFEKYNPSVVRMSYVTPGHFEFSVLDTVAELFTYSSISDLEGESGITDLLLEKDGDEYKYMDKIEIEGVDVYVPKLPIIILMKAIAYEKRHSSNRNDRNDLALLRGYLPGKYNIALSELKKLANEYESIAHLLDVHKKMFN